MNISHINFLSNCAFSFIKENALSSITAQQKKIAFIVAIAVGFLAALYAAIHCYAKATKLNRQHKITRLNGDVEEGRFLNGHLHGSGRRTTPNGVVELGMFANGRLQGLGKRTFGSESIHEGEFKDGFLNGKGKKTYSDGEIKEGEFNKGSLIKGKFSRIDGSVEEGEFSDETFSESLNGQGRRIAKDSIEEGNWKNGYLQGKGTLTDLLSGYVIEGNWEEGYLQGQGKRSLPNNYVEEGNFEVFSDKKSQLNAKINELHGKGKITFPDGSFLDGNFQMGVIQGKRTLPNGVIIEGELRQGQLHGHGKMTHLDGQVEEGIFEMGQFLLYS